MTSVEPQNDHPRGLYRPGYDDRTVANGFSRFQTCSRPSSHPVHAGGGKAGLPWRRSQAQQSARACGRQAACNCGPLKDPVLQVLKSKQVIG